VPRSTSGPATFRVIPDESDINYVVTWHAPVRGDETVLWVSIARWLHADGSIEWCLEYWDDVGEADHDLEVADEAAAMRHARKEFGIEEADWRPGPQPWGRPDSDEA
jgi:hypothetical protein